MKPELVEVNLPLVSHNAKVRINGEEWKSVRAINIDAAINQPTVVKLEFYADVTGWVERPLPWYRRATERVRKFVSSRKIAKLYGQARRLDKWPGVYSRD